MQANISSALQLISDLENLQIETKDVFSFKKMEKGFAATKHGKDIYSLSNNEIRNLQIDEHIFKGSVVNTDRKLKLKILNSGLSSADLNTQTYSINKLSSTNFESSLRQKLYYRLIFNHIEELHLKEFFSFTRLQVSEGFSTYVDSNSIEFTINGVSYLIFRNKEHFVIQSNNPVYFKAFSEVSRKILAALGFITGSCPGNEGYFFGYETYQSDPCVFVFDARFVSAHKATSLITTNPHLVLGNLGFEERQGKLKEVSEKLKPLNVKHFEKLVLSMLDDDKFSEAIYCFLSTSNAKSVHATVHAGMYAIVLEMLTAYIDKIRLKKNSGPKKENNTLSSEEVKTLKSKLHSVAEVFFINNNKSYEGSAFQKRVNGVDNPIHIDKLIYAYEYLGIELTNQERKNISSRNKLLHGSFPYKYDNLNLLSKYALYLKEELKYLTAALVFRYIGYEGSLLNLSKIYLDRFNLEVHADADYLK